VLADFFFFVKELGAQPAQFLTAAMFQLTDEKKIWRFDFHGRSTSGLTLSEAVIPCK
jgi:hypothetical protein